MHSWQATPIRDAVVRCLVLNKEPMSVREIAAALQMPAASIAKCVANTRLVSGCEILRIAHWRIEPRHQVPLFAPGLARNSCDALKPAPLSALERQRRYTARKGVVIAAKRKFKNGKTSPWMGLI